MEQESNNHEISVTWRGKKYTVIMNLAATLEELGYELQKLTAVKADTMKLIVQSTKSSKLLSPFSDEHSCLTLQGTSIIEGKPIQMMGVPKEEIDQVLKNAKTDMRIIGFDEEEKRIRQRMSNGFDTPLKLPSGNYVFGGFKTLDLPGIKLNPPASEALRLMHMLAADPGIVAIMNKHKWRVGIMTEMAPEGYVGVSPVCILGLNKNKGEEISLRLRTDDLKGFRKYQSIKKTLLHELAHMVFSEHNAKFYALDSQLNKEAGSLDWTKSPGHTLNGSQKTQQYSHEFHVTENSSLSHKLGGNQSSNLLANPRSSSVAAAYQRLVIASINNPSTTPESHNEPDLDDSDAMDINDGQRNYEPDPEDHEVVNDKNEPDPDDIMNNEAMESEPFDELIRNSDTSELNHDKTEEIQGSENEIKRENNEPDPDDGILYDEELQRIQDPVVIACNRLKKSIRTLQSEVSPSESAMVFQTLVKIVGNVIEHPGETKFKKLRKANPVIQKNIASYNGLGMVTPLGCGVETTWKRLIQGESGIKALSVEDIKMNGFDKDTQSYTFDQLTSKVAAIVPCDTKAGEFNESLWLDSKHGKSIARFISYALCAADEALKDANWIPSEQEDKEKTGVSIGGGIGSISDILDASQLICEKRLRRLSPFFVPRILINMAAGHVSMKYGFQGPNHAAVTACATGANSIGDAARMIQFGDADVMVAGGTEASIDALSIAGFCKLRALATKYNSTPQEASRPFDCDRDGFVIGEGAGVLVLEELEHAKKRGANIYAELRGYGMSGDAHHITQPHADGRGAILAMSRALKQSGLRPEQVDYVNAHATSTPLGDMVEARAIKTLFSGHATSGALAFSSTKGAIGHLLGAAGAVESIFTVLAIHNGIAPLSLNLSNPDPIFKEGFMPLTSSKEMQINAALSNAFGFGGTNAALLFTTL